MASGARGRAPRGIASAGFLAAAVATVANLALFLLARAAGVAFTVGIPGRGRVPVEAPGVALLTAAPMLLGTAVAQLLARRLALGLRLAQAAGGAVGLVSLLAPASVRAATATKIALGTMHVVAAIAFVLGLEAVRRRTGALNGPVRPRAA